MAAASYRIEAPPTRRYSSLSKEAVAFPVFAALAGAPYDPTAATFEVAFMGSGDPTGGDWKAGAWDVTVIGTYVGYVIIGPGGAAPLVAGEYYSWVRITDAASGEIIVRQTGQVIVQ
jgi:hypothetical protein